MTRAVVLAVLLAGCGSPLLVPSSSPPSSAPSETDPQAVAEALLVGYMAEVARGDFEAAWNRLSPSTQAAFGSKQQFASDRRAFMVSAGGIYRLATPSHDLDQLGEWINPGDPAAPPISSSFLAQVDYPRLADNLAGFDILVAAPDVNGIWRIWQVR